MSLILKQETRQIQKVSYLYAGGKKKNYISCPVCKQAPCYKHCNNCGIDIEFRKDEFDKWHPYEVMTSTIHKCHTGKPTKSGKFLDVNAKKYECILFREDHYNRYFLVRENGQLRRATEKKQDYHKMTPAQFRESTMIKHDKYKEWGAFSFEY